jgi:hypothetical protein
MCWWCLKLSSFQEMTRLWPYWGSTQVISSPLFRVNKLVTKWLYLWELSHLNDQLSFSLVKSLLSPRLGEYYRHALKTCSLVPNMSPHSTPIALITHNLSQLCHSTWETIEWSNIPFYTWERHVVSITALRFFIRLSVFGFTVDVVSNFRVVLKVRVDDNLLKSLH